MTMPSLAFPRRVAGFLISCVLAGATPADDHKQLSGLAAIDLPEGLIAEVAASSSLVKHPIMATLGDRGQLFVGDSSGTNLNKSGLEKALPHRVLLLTDTNA